MAATQLSGASLFAILIPRGNLFKPPVIKRQSGVPLTDQVLRSESQAITALSQCGPYLMTFGQDGLQVKFPGKL